MQDNAQPADDIRRDAGAVEGAADTTQTFGHDSDLSFVPFGSELSEVEWDAIGALPSRSALLLVRSGPTAGARYLLDADVTTVGRHPESDIFLDDITVSRHHAKFVRSAGHLYLEDLGSLNGTYVNRTLLDGRSMLREGDEIQIGKYRATISLSEPGTL